MIECFEKFKKCFRPTRKNKPLPPPLPLPLPPPVETPTKEKMVGRGKTRKKRTTVHSLRRRAIVQAYMKRIMREVRSKSRYQDEAI